VDIVVEAERTGGKGEEGVGSFEWREVAHLRADNFTVAKIEPAFHLLLAAPALEKDGASLFAEIYQLNNIGEMKLAQIAFECHNLHSHMSQVAEVADSG